MSVSKLLAHFVLEIVTLSTNRRVQRFEPPDPSLVAFKDASAGLIRAEWVVFLSADATLLGNGLKFVSNPRFNYVGVS